MKHTFCGEKTSKSSVPNDLKHFSERVCVCVRVVAKIRIGFSTRLSSSSVRTHGKTIISTQIRIFFCIYNHRKFDLCAGIGRLSLWQAVLPGFLKGWFNDTFSFSFVHSYVVESIWLSLKEIFWRMLKWNRESKYFAYFLHNTKSFGNKQINEFGFRWCKWVISPATVWIVKTKLYHKLVNIVWHQEMYDIIYHLVMN